MSFDLKLSVNCSQLMWIASHLLVCIRWVFLYSIVFAILKWRMKKKSFRFANLLTFSVRRHSEVQTHGQKSKYNVITWRKKIDQTEKQHQTEVNVATKKCDPLFKYSWKCDGGTIIWAWAKIALFVYCFYVPMKRETQLAKRKQMKYLGHSINLNKNMFRSFFSYIFFLSSFSFFFVYTATERIFMFFFLL